MTRLLTVVLGAAALSACTVPTYEAEPVSVYQWERRQQAIERQEAERVRRCSAARARGQASPDCASGEYISRDKEKCAGTTLHESVVETYPDGSCRIRWGMM